MTSGFPRVEFHTHADAHFDHVHDVQDHDESDGENFVALDEPGNTGVMHAHDVGAFALALASTVNVAIVAHWRADEEIPLPASKPPDSVIPPLYRPPIA